MCRLHRCAWVCVEFTVFTGHVTQHLIKSVTFTANARNQRTLRLTRTYVEYLTPLTCTWTRNHFHLDESVLLLIQLCFHTCKKNPLDCLPDSLISLMKASCIDHNKIHQHSTNSFLRQDRQAYEYINKYQCNLYS